MPEWVPGAAIIGGYEIVMTLLLQVYLGGGIYLWSFIGTCIFLAWVLVPRLRRRLNEWAQQRVIVPRLRRPNEGAQQQVKTDQIR